MFQDFELIIKLSDEEEKKLKQLIHRQRKALISSPKKTIEKVMLSHRAMIEQLLNNDEISKAIVCLRQLAYDQFLVEEAELNASILGEIGQEFNAPKHILESVSNHLYLLKQLPSEKFQEKVSCVFGEFAGRISPYIYQLCLSNTQSRRSRGGKVFERIIYFLYHYYGFSYESQASIGKKAFAELGLGKVVDSVLPNVEAFKKFRNKTIVGSMKTTLRERWQEVVEEIARSNLPNIHLLTVDSDISNSKAKKMAEHNIVLVVKKEVKNKEPLKDMHSIISFETYFTREVPEFMGYWEQCK